MKVEGGGYYLRAVNDGARTVITLHIGKSAVKVRNIERPGLDLLSKVISKIFYHT